MNNRKSQIDYILINSKWKNSLKNWQAYSSFASVGSDHRILSAKHMTEFMVQSGNTKERKL